jgi:hypothetical protein
MQNLTPRPGFTPLVSVSLIAILCSFLFLAGCGAATAPIAQLAAPGNGTSTGSGGTGSTTGGTTGSGTSGGSTSGTSGGTGGSTAPLITLENVEDTTAWNTCGACGNDAGNLTLPTLLMENGLADPSQDGRSTRFTIADAPPFTDGFWWLEQAPVPTEMKFLRYEFDLYVPAEFERTPQAIEFECQQQLGGWIYNFAFQANYAAGDWRVYDYASSRWDSINVPFGGLTPGAWHHIASEFHNDITGHIVYHDALEVDGTRFALTNVVHAAAYRGYGDKFTNAFQLDTNGFGKGYNTVVDKMKISYRTE